MKNTQLIIPDMPVNPLDEALANVRDLALPHPHYNAFAREVAENVLGQRSGSVLLCAAPADIDCDELIASIGEELAKRHYAREKTPFPGLQVIGTPSPLRRGSGAASLFNAYHNPLEKPGTHHRFQLEFGEAYHARDQFHVVSSLVKCAPVGAYVVKNVHVLQTPRQGMDGVIEAVLTLAEIARQSKRTHVLMGHTSVVLEWLTNPDIAREVFPFLLAPYDTDERNASENEGTDRVDFLDVLRAYDGILPWNNGDSLEAHFDEVAGVVSGSPHRLRKWLQTALCKAQAESETELHWSRVVACQSPRCERMEAWNELNCVRRYRDIDEDPAIAGAATGEGTKIRKKRQCPPGIRNPTRDAAAAA